MKTRKPRIIKDAKARGEWVESVFMARAGERGLAVSKPWGESRSYDFVIGHPGRFVSVQVKSTVCRSGGGYECCLRGRGNKAYARGSFDFVAAYVVKKDAWYIIPAEKVLGRETVCLFSKSKFARYEEYREAWDLLRMAVESPEETPAELPAASEPPGFPRNPLERVEAAMDFARRAMQGTSPRRENDEG